MQKIILTILFYISAGITYAQQANYIYIETGNGQPFYVKINDKVQSSSQGGYLILSGLKENSYDIRIGFPKDAFPEQRFTIAVNKKDQGFQLKNFGEKGWGLFNLQSLALVMNSNLKNNEEEDNKEKKTDGFSVLLSKVVNDPAILTTSPTPIKDTIATSQVIVKQEQVIKQDQPVIFNKPVTVRKLFEEQSVNEYRAAYIDRNNGINDTIHISYPIIRN